MIDQSILNEDKEIKFDVRYGIHLHFIEDTKTLIISVSVKIPSKVKNVPFKALVEGTAQFVFKNLPADVQRFGRINCAAIIFPFIRESVAELSRKAGMNPPILLPPVNFQKIYEDEQKKGQEKERSKRKSAN